MSAEMKRVVIPERGSDPTADDLARLEAEATECDRLNTEAHKDLCARWDSLLADARKFYGSRFAYKGKAPKGLLLSPENQRNRVLWWRNDVERARKTADDLRLAEEYVREREILKVRAVLWLHARGKEPGRDYAPDKALEAANNIAFAEECARRTDKAQKEPIEFSGQNCEGPCSGWDGESRRCECGNRRVSWSRDSLHTFEQPSISAEAY